MTDIPSLVKAIFSEHQAVLDGIDERAATELVDEIKAARRIFVLGEGRSGLVLRMLATRLMHLGRPAFVIGETITPGIVDGDLLIACSGSGATEVTCLLAEKGITAGARLAAITADPTSRLAKAAHVTLVLPTPHKRGAGRVPSIQYGGSLFEQTALLLLEAVVLALMPEDAVPTGYADLIARHANLE